MTATLDAPTQAPEPTDDAAPSTAPSSEHRNRLRGFAVSVVLVCLAFVQQPGLIVPDTKLDLTANPMAFLGRALHLWDPIGFSGQLQNQAYGYLFPMGPFFAVGHALALPPWVVQRLWWALLLLLAFHGARRLITALGVGTATSALVGAVAFALSARFLTVMGAESVEVWPMALAPWVLLPLVNGSRGGSERRAAAWSAVAIVCLGGVNAVASGAALVLPVWWLLTRARGPRRRRLATWWCLFAMMAVAWWVVPLLLLGRYSPPFLDWIESASVTTAPMSLVNLLRGTSDWVALVSDGRGPIWPAGAALATQSVLILDLVVVAAFGVAGLVHPRLAQRRFLIGAVLIGVALMTVGHHGPWSPPWWHSGQALLDGVGSPLRNLHKFQVLVVLPLSVGVAHLLGQVQLTASQRVWLRRLPHPRAVLTGVALLAVVGAAAPAVAGRLPAPGAYLALPDYWRQTATWLSDHSTSAGALVVPGDSTPVSYWGDSGDEPLQALATTPWTSRTAVPLSSAGNIRVLDVAEQTLSGSGNPGLSSFLARAGIKYVVVRNDLDWARTGTPRPMVVLNALERSGGFRLVAWFGPEVGTTPQESLLIDHGLDARVPAIEVFRVEAYRGPVETTPVSEALDVVGGPESLQPLAADGVLGHQATVLAGDRPAGLTLGTTVVTDGLRRSEVDFGLTRDNRSATMTAGQAYQRDRPVHDYLPDSSAPQTVLRYDSHAGVSASSSAAQVGSWPAVDPGAGPFAAFDGDPRTAWRPAGGQPAVGQWLAVDWRRPRSVSELPVVFWHDGARRISRVRVSSDHGSWDVSVPPTAGRMVLPVVSGATTRLRVTVLAVSGASSGSSGSSGSPGDVGLTEVDVPGVAVARTFDVPDATGPWRPTVFSFSAGLATDGCVSLASTTRCDPSLQQVGEEDSGLDRTFAVARSGRYTAFGSIQAVGGAALDRLLVPLGPALLAGASSTLTSAPAVRPQAAVDDDVRTSWIAAADDPAPRLFLRWPRPFTVSALRLTVDPTLGASTPTRVRISTRPDGSRGYRAVVGSGGVVRFPPVRADHLSITVLAGSPAASVDPVTSVVSVAPVAVSEVRLLGVPDQRRPVLTAAASGLACGSAPSLSVDGVEYPMQATGTVGDVLTGRPLSWQPCSGAAIPLDAGVHRLRVVPVAQARPVDVVLAPVGWSASDRATGQPDVLTWSATDRSLAVPARNQPQLLQVHENANDGWRATLDGQALTPVRVDGWQQGWLLPTGAAGVVHLRFAPDGPYRWGLLAGLLLALLVVVAALVPGRSRRPETGPGGRAASWWGIGVVVLTAATWLVGLVAVVGLGTAWLWSVRSWAAIRALAVVGLLTGGFVVAVDPPAQLGRSGVAAVVELSVALAVAALWATGSRLRRRGCATADAGRSSRYQLAAAAPTVNP